MSTLTSLNFDTGPQGTTLTAGNTGATFIAVGNGATFDTAGAFQSTYGAKFTTTATPQVSDGRMTATVSSTTMNFRIGIKWSVTPADELEIVTLRNSAGIAFRIVVDVSNRIKIYDAANANQVLISTALTAGSKYEVGGYLVAGASTTTGTYSISVFNQNSNTATFGPITASNYNVGTTAFTAMDFGVIGAPSYAATVWIDSPQMTDGLTTTPNYLGYTGNPPVAVIDSTTIGHTVEFDGSTSSTATSPATLASYAWAFGDGGTSTAAQPVYHYLTAGSYTASLTVEDSNGLFSSAATQGITIVDGGTSVVAVSIGTAVGWTPNGSTQLSTISDFVNTTFTYSVISASAQEFDIIFNPIMPPQSGQPFIVTLVVDRYSSASGSVAAQIFDFDGVTQRSSLTGVTISDMIASGGSGTYLTGTVLGVAQLVFPWSDVQNVGATGWDQLTLKLQFTVS